MARKKSLLSPEEIKIDFNNSFLNQIVFHCIQSTEFLQKIRNTFPLHLFKSSERTYLMEMIFEYYDSYKVAPKENFYDLFKEREKVIRKDLYNRIVDLIGILKDITGSNPEYIEQSIDDALYHFQLEEAVVQMASLLKKKKYDKIKEIMQLAMKPPEGVQDEYHDYFTDKSYIKDRIKENRFKLKTNIKGLDKIIGGINPPWLVTILGSTKAGKCIPEHSPITLSNGSIVTMKEVVEKKLRNIITYNESTGKLEKGIVSQHYDNGIKPCFKVTTRTGRTSEATGNHPLLTVNGWKNLEDLNIGESIAVPKEIKFFGNKKVSLQEVSLLAYLIADGHLSSTKGISFTKNEKNIIEDFKRCVRNIGDEVSKYNNRNQYLIVKKLNSKINKTRKILERCKLIDKKSIDKFIPEKIMCSTEESISEFLSVLFTCDGSISKSGNKIEISYSTISKKLAEQVFYLLSKFGIIARLRTRKNNKYDNYTFYTIEIKDKENILLFISKIGFKFSKGDKCIEYSKFLKNRANNRGFLSAFPKEYTDIVYSEVYSFISKTGKKNRKWWQQKPLNNLSSAKKRNYGLSKQTVKEIAKIINSSRLKKDVNSDIFWDEVVSIEYIGDLHTYDLTVPKHHNFISGNTIVHNTWTLIESAVNAINQGLNVVYVSLEMNFNQTKARFDQVIGFLSNKECDEPIDVMSYRGGTWIKSKERIKSIYDIDVVEKNTRRFKKTSGGGLKIIAYNRGRLNHFDIARILDNIERNEGFIPDVIVVDYLGIMRQTENGQSKKDRVTENCLGLKDLCGERNIIGFTAMQGNRSAMQSATFKSHQVADDIDTIFTSDLILAICQTPKEEKANKCRLYVANFRHGPQHFHVGIIRDLNIGQAVLGEFEVTDNFNEDTGAEEEAPVENIV